MSSTDPCLPAKFSLVFPSPSWQCGSL